MSLTEDIKSEALDLGFDLVGITSASPIDTADVKLLTRWLEAGCAGRMNYMHRNFQQRINPAQLLEGAQSVICLGLNYNPPKTQPKSTVTDTPIGRLAAYAQYEDYHLFIKKRLRKLTDFMTSFVAAALKFKVCVDSAPLAERALAGRAGLGFIGKNRMLINPELGPHILLGEIITSLKLETDKPLENACSDCDKCINACPTKALSAEGRLDARKCISYLTIEYEGQISLDLARKMGSRLFGCDECILACPYHDDAPLRANKQFRFYNDRAELDLHRILQLTQDEFDSVFADSPLKRLPLPALRRNAKICLTNTRSHGASSG